MIFISQLRDFVFASVFMVYHSTVQPQAARYIVVQHGVHEPTFG